MLNLDSMRFGSIITTNYVTNSRSTSVFSPYSNKSGFATSWFDHRNQLILSRLYVTTIFDRCPLIMKSRASMKIDAISAINQYLTTYTKPCLIFESRCLHNMIVVASIRLKSISAINWYWTSNTQPLHVLRRRCPLIIIHVAWIRLDSVSA